MMRGARAERLGRRPPIVYGVSDVQRNFAVHQFLHHLVYANFLNAIAMPYSPHPWWQEWGLRHAAAREAAFGHPDAKAQRRAAGTSERNFSAPICPFPSRPGLSAIGGWKPHRVRRKQAARRPQSASEAA